MNETTLREYLVKLEAYALAWQNQGKFAMLDLIMDTSQDNEVRKHALSVFSHLHSTSIPHEQVKEWLETHNSMDDILALKIPV